MSSSSAIEWTNATWNPIVGCSIVSPGCTNCYAMKMAWRLQSAFRTAIAHNLKPEQQAARHYDGTVEKVNGNAVWTGKIQLAPENILEAPAHWKKPRRIFVNSMSDLFHELIPDGWIDHVFTTMAAAHQHTFQVLTKRAERMYDYATRASSFRRSMPLPNVWLGVSCERQQEADERIPLLLQTPAAIRFISAEPLLGPINLTRMKLGGGWYDVLAGWRDVKERFPGFEETLDWVIVGGESGPNARPMHPQWATDICDQCLGAGVPFFFKQWGTWIPSNTIFGEFERVGKKAAGRLLDGVERNGFPEVQA